MPRIGKQRQRMRGDAIENLGQDIDRVERHADGESATKAYRGVAVAADAVVMMPIRMAVVIVRFMVVIMMLMVVIMNVMVIVSVILPGHVRTSLKLSIAFDLG